MAKSVIAAAQVASKRGELEHNLEVHLQAMERAAAVGVQLLVFPELSLTGYELELAQERKLGLSDPIFEQLGEAARRWGMKVVVGAPWDAGGEKPLLGAFWLGDEAPQAYAKLHVHSSEQPYFAAGTQLGLFAVGEDEVGLAICADTGVPEHAAQLAAKGAQLYAASVMKTPEEYPAHARRMEAAARSHQMLGLTANYAGPTGGFASAGRSALWDPRGSLLAIAPTEGPALVVARCEDDRWKAEVLLPERRHPQSLRTDYGGHEAIYQRKKDAGQAGWDPQDISDAVITQYQRLLEHPDVPSEGRLLELGCGAGNLSVGFAEMGFEVEGIDISITAIDWARERYPHITFHLGDVLNLSRWQDGAFDLVVDSHCFHCIVGEDRMSFLSEIRQTLGPHGVLAINTMCQNPHTPTLAGFDPTTGVVWRDGVATRLVGTRARIEDELQRAGFDIIDSYVEIDEGELADSLLMLLKPSFP